MGWYQAGIGPDDATEWYRWYKSRREGVGVGVVTSHQCEIECAVVYGRRWGVWIRGVGAAGACPDDDKGQACVCVSQGQV